MGNAYQWGALVLIVMPDDDVEAQRLGYSIETIALTRASQALRNGMAVFMRRATFERVKAMMHLSTIDQLH